MRLKQLNKIGVFLAIMHTIILIAVAAWDRVFTHYFDELSHSGAHFLNLVMVLDLPAFFLQAAILQIKIPVLSLLGDAYFLSGWVPVLHYVIFGGLMYYFIGVLLSKIPKLFQRSQRKGDRHRAGDRDA